VGEWSLIADALQIRIRKFAQYAAAITIFLGSPRFTDLAVSISMIFHVVRTAFDRTLSRFEILGLVALIHMTFALAFKELHKKTLLRSLENEWGIGLFFIFSLIIVLYPFDSRAWSNGYGRLRGGGGFEYEREHLEGLSKWLFILLQCRSYNTAEWSQEDSTSNEMRMHAIHCIAIHSVDDDAIQKYGRTTISCAISDEL
jgi:hypothetical protein